MIENFFNIYERIISIKEHIFLYHASSNTFKVKHLFPLSVLILSPKSSHGLRFKWNLSKGCTTFFDPSISIVNRKCRLKSVTTELCAWSSPRLRPVIYNGGRIIWFPIPTEIKSYDIHGWNEMSLQTREECSTRINDERKI